jgi:SPW repeat
MLDKKMFDWTNLILGLWVLISPWVLGFTASTGALWSAVVLGILVIAVSAWALYQPPRRLPEWVNLVLGVLLFLAPWALGYVGMATAAWNSWALGAVIALFAAWTFLPRMRTPEPTHR